MLVRKILRGVRRGVCGLRCLVVLMAVVFVGGNCFAGDAFFSCVTREALADQRYLISVSDGTDSGTIELAFGDNEYNEGFALDTVSTSGIGLLGLSPVFKKRYYWRFDGCFNDMHLDGQSRDRKDVKAGEDHKSVERLLSTVFPYLIPTGISPGGSVFILRDPTSNPLLSGPISPNATMSDSRIIYHLNKKFMIYDVLGREIPYALTKEAAQDNRKNNLISAKAYIARTDDHPTTMTFTMERMD